MLGAASLLAKGGCLAAVSPQEEPFLIADDERKNVLLEDLPMTSTTRRAVALGLGLSPLLAHPAVTQTPTRVSLGYTAVSDFLGAFCAQEEGFFRARGLEVNFQLITLNSNIPAALQSDSVQIGGPTAPVLLQANDGGLDLVAIAGGSFSSRAVVNTGVVERTGAGITDAKSFEGRRVGVPGLGAFLHVLFRQWMQVGGADWRKVNFVETPFIQMPDILRGGSIDAVVTGSPIMERIVSGNIGRVVSNILNDLPDGIPSIPYATTRAWATRNGPAIAAFRGGLAEGMAFMRANDAKAREHLAKYIRLPPEIIRTAIITFQKPQITPADFAFWVDVMKGQDMLRGAPPDAARIVWPTT